MRTFTVVPSVSSFAHTCLSISHKSHFTGAGVTSWHILTYSILRTVVSTIRTLIDIYNHINFITLYLLIMVITYTYTHRIRSHLKHEPSMAAAVMSTRGRIPFAYLSTVISLAILTLAGG